MGDPVDADVVVVGGGPVGVVTALLCARGGLSVVVLERDGEIYDLPRAIVADDEVQRVWAAAGLGSDLDRVTTPLGGAEFVDGGGARLFGVDLPLRTDWPLGYHPVVCYYQPHLEEVLRRHAVAAGVDLRLGAEVVAVDQDGDAVWAETSAGRVRGRWLVAADGASSPVRKHLGVEVEDQGFDQQWLVTDLRLTGVDASVPGALGLPAAVQQICDPLRPATYVPGFGPYRRWEFQVQPHDDVDTLVEPDALWGLLEPWIGPGEAEVVRAVVYRFHATVAASMAAGRVLLAGDAAHQMPPFLGQGLCAGVRDAANLAWKLAAVAGGAPARLLDSYDSERRPHAAGVVAMAADTGRLVDELAGRTPAVTDAGGTYTSAATMPSLGLGVLAGDHPLVGRPLRMARLATGTVVDRLSGRWTILAPDDGVAQRVWCTSVEVLAADELDALGVGPRGALVVRPDLYVAAATPDATGLDGVLAELAGWIEADTGGSGAGRGRRGAA